MLTLVHSCFLLQIDSGIYFHFAAAEARMAEDNPFEISTVSQHSVDVSQSDFQWVAPPTLRKRESLNPFETLTNEPVFDINQSYESDQSPVAVAVRSCSKTRIFSDSDCS